MQSVSCVMVTTEGRIDLCRRAIESFSKQNYPNRELVIVAVGTLHLCSLLRQLLLEAGLCSGQVVHVDRRWPLGHLRNVAIENAQGTFVCQWDDDDVSHPNRINAQLAGMLKASADVSYMAEHLHFFQSTGKIYLCDWRRSSRHIGHPGTLIARRESLVRYSDDLEMREDSDLYQSLLKQGVSVSAVPNIGELYTYVHHGKNLCSHSHHSQLVRSYGCERATLLEKAEVLRAALKEYPFDSLSVVDHLGEEVFRWRQEEQVS